MIPATDTPHRSGRDRLAAAAAATLWLVLLLGFSYLRFPRQVVLLKAEGKAWAEQRTLEFRAEPGPPANIWTLEIEAQAGPIQAAPIRVLLNDLAVGTLSGARAKGKLVFAAARLRKGGNRLRIEAPPGWTCRRIALRDVTGYASGVFPAVLVPKANHYSKQGLISSSIPFILLAALLAVFIYCRVLDFKRIPRFFRCWSVLMTASAAAIVFLPLFSRYRILLGPSTALLWTAAWWGDAAFAAGRKALGWTRRRLRSPAARWSAFLLAAFAVIVLFVPGPGPETGDGREYRALLVSLARFGTPYITPASCAYLDDWSGRPPSAPEEPSWSWIHHNLKTLDQDGQADLTHFWFYSLLAAVFFWPVKLAGLPPGLCFSLLHIVLLAAAFAAVRKALGARAGLSLLLLVFVSPLVWFVNKGQVEFFTVLAALVGTASLAAENYAPAALAFGLAATQNPPFAALAGLALVLGILRRGFRSLRPAWPAWAAAGFLCVLQPAYYFFRFGVVNPVLATGAARLGGDPLTFKKMAALFIDPDVGLFPNWPAGVLLLAGLGFLAARRKAGLKAPVWIFLALSSVVLAWSQAQTQNMNHGGTLDISRYALWYLFVFFLALWRIVEDLARRPPAVRRAWAVAGLALGLAIAAAYWPGRPEAYMRPTGFSRFLYDRWPGLYDPVPEIFFERIRGEEEAPPNEIWAVSNPSGSKILIFPERLWFRKDSEVRPIPSSPDLDPVLVFREAKRRADREPGRTYFYLDGRNGRFLRR